MPEKSAVALSVILPAKDEAQNVDAVLEDAFLNLARWTRSFEVIVVNDGSRDATGKRLAHHQNRRANLKVINHRITQGYGAALQSGFAAARGDLVFFTDCDGQFRFAELEPLLALIDKEGLDVVLGSRVDRQDPPVRKFYSLIYNRLAAGICGIRVRDINCAFKLFRRPALSAMTFHRQDYLINVEMLAWTARLGLRWREVGVRHYPRTAGRSKVRLADSIKTVLGLIKIKNILSKRKTGAMQQDYH